MYFGNNIYLLKHHYSKLTIFFFSNIPSKEYLDKEFKFFCAKVYFFFLKNINLYNFIDNISFYYKKYFLKSHFLNIKN